MEKDYPEFLGALPDTRSPEAKEKDYKSEEILASAPQLNWKELDLSTIPVFFTKNQLYSSSCVAQTVATMKSRNQFREEGKAVETSATPIYFDRVNKPGLGMIGDDALQIAKKKGTTLEVLVPSNMMSEEDMNTYPITKLDRQIGQILRADGYFYVSRTMDGIASVMEANRRRGIALPVMIWFQFRVNGSWWKNIPEGEGSGDMTRHSVTGIEYGLYKGEKVIIIQESAGVSSTLFPNKKNLRIITEDYLRDHCVLAAYETDLKNDWRDNPAIPKPTYTFTTSLEWSPVFNVNQDVVALQNILKYEGIFASETESTGYYGNYTASCVLKYQNRYGIPDDNLKGRRVGPKTIADLNSRYGN